MIFFRATAFTALLILVTGLVFGDSRESLITNIDGRFDQNREIALNIWELAEMGYLEERSTALLQKTLSAEGFRVEPGVAGIPTAFVAEAGSGKPVIAVLAEFDALPGITQTASPVREKIPGKAGVRLAGTTCLVRHRLVPP